MTDVDQIPSDGMSATGSVRADLVEPTRTGMQAPALQRAITDHLRYSVGRPAAALRPEHYYRALALAVRDRMQDRRVASTQTSLDLGRKVTCYLSAEFLMGPQLGNNLLNLRMEQAAKAALAAMGQDLDEVLACEEEPGLGNGGLGRRAACYLDSLATLERPAIGYGIRYEFGIFDQEIHDGWQVEKTDNWLVNGNPWEIAKPDVNYLVKWGGYAEHYTDDGGRDRVRWVPGRMLKWVAHDTPIQGYGLNTCNVLTLWSARAVESFALEAFNTGDYYKAVEDEVTSETVTKVLYPNDEPEAGKRLRLLQQYFFVSCSLQHVLHIMDDLADVSVRELPQRFALQLNDTHPSIAVAELMRLLLDERHLDWDEAWDITVATFGYTNHTLLPEALETWPLEMFAESLPRHLGIIYEINHRFLDEVACPVPRRRQPAPPDVDHRGGRQQERSDGPPCDRRQPRHQRCRRPALGATEIQCAQRLLRDVAGAVQQQDKWRDAASVGSLGWPTPGLRELLDRTVGDGWLKDMQRLRGLEPFVDDAAFRQQWRDVKRTNKARLAEYVRSAAGVELNPDWLFDIQVKRIHEYKRQHLNALHIITLYHRLKQNPDLQIPPRAFIFGPATSWPSASSS
jgi:glycogen phosphorylase